MKLHELRSKALRAAHQIRKMTGCSFSHAQRAAWANIRSKTEKIGLVTFKKVSGEVTTRIVYLGGIGDMVGIIGTGKPLGPDRKAYIDMVKFWTGEDNPVISVYKDRIVSQQVYN